MRAWVQPHAVGVSSDSSIGSSAHTLRGEVDGPRAERQAEMLAGRVKKAFKRLHGNFEAQDIGAFRLYDWDIPEVRAVVDWYEGHLVIGEYERRQTQSAGDWLYIVGTKVAEALGVPPAFVHLKRRKTGGGKRYRPDVVAPKGKGPGAMRVRERGLKFRVNLYDYLDTGLFPDQRDARKLIKQKSEGRAVLNLYAYTGTFSASALAGGATHVTSVDQSRTYLDWSQTNLRENQLALHRHEPARAEVFDFLSHAAQHGRKWDLIIVDPPSFSTLGVGGKGFDVQRDHTHLLDRTLRVLSSGGSIHFSTNHQRFEPMFEDLGFRGDIRETTDKTVPKDYRNRQIHRSWCFENCGN